uniref:Uncharacterized protein n=1 Tax=Arundo donax TaxID=35708 RepID=A0A0A8ZR48_ARUDO
MDPEYLPVMAQMAMGRHAHQAAQQARLLFRRIAARMNATRTASLVQAAIASTPS